MDPLIWHPTELENRMTRLGCIPGYKPTSHFGLPNHDSFKPVLKTSNSIHSALPIQKLPPLPTKKRDHIRAASLYTSPNGKLSIFVCLEHDGIFEYDLHQQTWTLLVRWCQYDLHEVDIHSIQDLSCIVDNHTHKLHIVGTYGTLYAIYDIQSKDLEIKNDCSEPIGYHLESPQTIFVHSDLHIVSCQHPIVHIVSDTASHGSNADAFMQLNDTLSEFQRHKLRDFEVIYIESLEQFMLIGGRKRTTLCVTEWIHNRDLLCCDTTYFEWRKSGISLPDSFPMTLNKANKNLILCSLILYDYILLIVHACTLDIWCLDLLDNSWSKSERKFVFDGIVPSVLERVKCIKTDDYTVHFMSNDICMRFGKYKNNDSFHVAVSVSDLIPMRLKRKYHERYVLLMFGYSRDCQLFISSDVVRLIVHLFSGLLSNL